MIVYYHRVAAFAVSTLNSTLNSARNVRNVLTLFVILGPILDPDTKTLL